MKILSLEERIPRIVQAALLELDAKWRNGTANADFKDPRTMQLLRGEAGIHESEVRMLAEWIDEGRLRFECGENATPPARYRR